MDFKGHLIYAIVLGSVVGCTHSTKLAGGGATAMGEGAFAFGGPVGQSTQIVNITDGNHATTEQNRAIERAMEQALEAIRDYDVWKKPSDTEIRLKKLERIDINNTPRDFRTAFREFVSSFAQLNKFIDNHGDDFPTFENIAERRHLLEVFGTTGQEIANVAKDYGWR